MRGYVQKAMTRNALKRRWDSGQALKSAVREGRMEKIGDSQARGSQHHQGAMNCVADVASTHHIGFSLLWGT